MALRKIPIAPGFDKQQTATQAEGRWIDGDNVRFRYGSPEKIGGWQQNNADRLAGASRAIHTWSALDGTKLAAIGTNKTLNLYTGDTFYDITPLASTVATCSMTSTTGSTTITIDRSSHGLEEGAYILFANTTIPATTDFTNADFTSNIVFEIQARSNNSFNVVMATAETGSGMSSAGNVDVEPYVTIGPIAQTYQYGFGTATWGLSTWGTARASSSVTLAPGSWSLDNFGEKLVATIHNGKTFDWDPSAANPLETRATVVAGAPTKSVMTLVSDRDRHLIHFGTETTIGDTATQDKMYLRFSDQENMSDYTPVSTNTAGTMRLDQGTRIVGAIQGKDYILIVTDQAAYTMQFVGPPFTFSIRQVGSGCGAVGQHSLVFANGRVFWMGISGGFFMFDGTVKTLPCLVEDFVFKTTGSNLGFNFDTGSDLVYAGHNNLYGEVQWFYPQSGATQIDRIVSFNYDAGVWTTGTLDRTSWADASVFSKPQATRYYSSNVPTFPTIRGASNGSTVLFDQETGTDEARLYSTGTVTTAISSSLRSGDFDLDIDGDGEYYMNVRRFIPDFKELSGTVNISIYLRRFPNDTAASSSLGPFTISTSTQQVWTRARSRLASVQLESDKTGQSWRYGLFRFDANQDGRR